MINQKLSLLDENWTCGANIFSPITVSGTYPFKVFVNGVEVFYGNKYFEIGDTNPRYNIIDILHFTRWIPKWEELNQQRNYTTCDLIGTVIVETYSKDGSSVIGRNVVTFGNIFRYPNRKEDMEMMFADPTYYVDLPPAFPKFNSMIQGMIYDKNQISEGRMSSCQGYRLLPRFTKNFNDSTNHICYPFTFQIWNPSIGGSNRLYTAIFDENYNLNSSVEDNELVPTGITTGYISTILPLSDATKKSYIGAWIGSSSSVPSTNNIQIIGKIDTTDEARYYLLWQDRYGGFQSQPFCKTETFSESIETANIKEYTNKRRIIQSNLQPKWEINTGWIDADLYPFYESMFISPFIVLSDTAEQIQYEVIITNKEYIEKTFKNQGRKLFNLKLTVELAAPQQITF